MVRDADDQTQGWWEFSLSLACKAVPSKLNLRICRRFLEFCGEMDVEMENAERVLARMGRENFWSRPVVRDLPVCGTCMAVIFGNLIYATICWYRI